MLGLYWFLSYIVGNFMTAYVVGKAYGVNLQEERSKNLGARNAGSVIGKGAFLWTFLGDSLKGVLIVGAGCLLHFEEWEIVIGASLGMLGHMFPFWLKFNGGKGVATFIGVGLALSPGLFFMMVVGTAIILIVTRSLTLSMIGGFLLYAGAIIYTDKLVLYMPILVAIFFMIIKHMSNVKEVLEKRK
ncbi:glycerol-3-phosphate acyltransferase [Lysinibacillus xylanilyticus]|uniref:Glycerol-3-phosphate acyltransferase n=1 Tax=Lysinibacillus xylanilyticus TaxID=582475 RepID=A0ABT4EQ44_9BACI|nr:glycerol-3-phosphate acyltransferase [Lysinibacillus xylanilyticus]MCY9547787.1 glycerol-3-phosphate acyltransferase [Lysinibacillus xylanilyticus]